MNVQEEGDEKEEQDQQLDRFTNCENFYHDELINEIFLLPDYFFIRRIAPFENELHSDASKKLVV